MSPPTRPSVARGMAAYQRGRDVAEGLIGTCRDVGDFATDEEQNDQDFCAGLDDVAFRCAECEWWCEQCEGHDSGGETYCDDCWQGDEDD